MLHNNRIFFILIIMLPAGLLVIDEIRNLILYSNPTRARRVESERRKAARRTFYKIKGKQLAALLLISGFVFAGIITYNLGENGPMVLRSENKIDNSGFLPMVYVLTDDNSEQILNIHPWYGVISPANETRVTTTDNTAVQISSAPYILPIFWIIALAGINPYLPVVSEIVIYTSVFIIILFPFWYKKSIRGRHKKKIRLNRLILQWKRKLHLE
jgi:signal peptidase